MISKQFATMHKILTFMALSFCFFSCLTSKDANELYKVEYKNHIGYKNLYIVDTITIEKPVLFYTEGGHLIISETENFISNKTHSDNILSHDGFFLFHNGTIFEFSAISTDIVDKFPEEKYSNYLNTYKKIYFPEKKLYARICDKHQKFVLLLVSKAYYNLHFAAIDGPPSIKGDNDFIYYKILVPLVIDDNTR